MARALNGLAAHDRSPHKEATWTSRPTGELRSEVEQERL